VTLAAIPEDVHAQSILSYLVLATGLILSLIAAYICGKRAVVQSADGGVKPTSGSGGGGAKATSATDCSGVKAVVEANDLEHPQTTSNHQMSEVACKCNRKVSQRYTSFEDDKAEPDGSLDGQELSEMVAENPRAKLTAGSSHGRTVGIS